MVRKLLSPLVLALILLAALPGTGSATLIQGPVSDMVQTFSATAEWSASVVPVDVWTPIGGTNWIFTLVAVQLGAASSVNVIGNHIATPHAGEISNPNPVFVVLNVGPGGSASQTYMTSHPAGPHFDALRVRVTSLDSDTSRIDISAVHAPEPATMALGALGVAFFALSRRFRRS